MRPKGSAEVLEARRRWAVRLLQQGYGDREVARLIGCSPSSVTRWKEVVRKSGMEGLAAKRHPGPRPRLSESQKEKLVELLLEGPKAHGCRNDLWTLPRVAQVIEKHFGVRYHPAHVWKILHAMRWSCQKPERRAKERDEEKIEQWRKETWPHIKKRARGGA
jgi:transposase